MKSRLAILLWAMSTAGCVSDVRLTACQGDDDCRSGQCNDGGQCEPPDAGADADAEPVSVSVWNGAFCWGKEV